MRVLHVAQPHDAGVPRIAGDLAADQVCRGWEVTVACPHDCTLRGFAAEVGAGYLRWDAKRAPGPSVPGEVRRLAILIQEANPDLVHLHSAKAGLAGRLVVRGRRPTLFQPNAWSFESVREPLRTATVAWERAAARWTSATVCVSEDERQHGESAGIGGRFVMVPNGVDLSRWPSASPADRAAARRELALDDAPLVVCVGRLSEQKGQDVLLRAWEMVSETAPAARLALIGDGPLRADLEAIAPAGVRFVGQTDRVRPWLEAASVIAQPSRWEGMSLSVLEALACARSVVVTDVPGMREVAEGVGAVIPPEDPAALRDALLERLHDPAGADAEGAAGRTRVEERHDVRLAAARMAELYESITAAA